MREYGFTLVLEGEVGSRIDALLEAGCDDAAFGEVDGTPYADFEREEASFGEAVVSAIRDVESVGGVRVRHVEPDDLVTLSEIAGRLGRSRESVRLLAGGERGPGGFPAPVSHLRSRSRLWRWSDVAVWFGLGGLGGKDVYEGKEQLYRASLTASINAALELRANSANLRQSERELIASLEA